MKDPLIDSQFRAALLAPIDRHTARRRDEHRSRRGARWQATKRRLRGFATRIFLGLLFIVVSALILDAESLNTTGRLASMTIWSLPVLGYVHRRLNESLWQSPDLNALSLWPVPPQQVAQRQLLAGAGHWVLGPGFLTFLIGYLAAAIYWRPSLESILLALLAALSTRWMFDILSLLALRWTLLASIARLGTACIWIFYIVGRIPWIQENTLYVLNQHGDWFTTLIPLGWIYRLIFPMPITDESMHSSLAWLAIFSLWLPMACLWLRRRTIENYTAWWAHVQSEPFMVTPSPEVPSQAPSPTDAPASQLIHPVSTSEPSHDTPTVSTADLNALRQRLQTGLTSPSHPPKSLSFADRLWIGWLTPHENAVWNLTSKAPPQILHHLQRGAFCLMLGWLALTLKSWWPGLTTVVHFAPQGIVLFLLLCRSIRRGFDTHSWINQAYAPVSLFPIRWKDIHRIHLKHALIMSALSFPLFLVYEGVLAYFLLEDASWALITAIKWTACIVPAHMLRTFFLNASVSRSYARLTLRNLPYLTVFLVLLISLTLLIPVSVVATWGPEGAKGLLGSLLLIFNIWTIHLLLHFHHNRRHYDLGKPSSHAK